MNKDQKGMMEGGEGVRRESCESKEHVDTRTNVMENLFVNGQGSGSQMLINKIKSEAILFPVKK